LPESFGPLDSTRTFSEDAAGHLTAVQYPALGSPNPGQIQLTDLYGYAQAGLPADKRLAVSESLDLDQPGGLQQGWNGS
jgi:hypothetical protein